MKRIYDDHVNHAWHPSNFRLFRAVFTHNNGLATEGGFLFNYIAETYIDSSLMLVRREMDLASGTENFRHLLEDIRDHPTVLTRRRYLDQWGDPCEASIANRAFNSFKPVRSGDDPSNDHVDPAVVGSEP